MSNAHNGMLYDPIQGQGQGHKPLKVENPSIFKCYLLRHLQRELATEHWCINYGRISKFDRAVFFIFVLVFVSRDFEIGRNSQLWRVDRQSRTGLIF